MTSDFAPLTALSTSSISLLHILYHLPPPTSLAPLKIEKLVRSVSVHNLWTCVAALEIFHLLFSLPSSGSLVA